MPLKAVDEGVIKGIADALREANDNPNAKYKPKDFPAAVSRASDLGGEHDLTFKPAIDNIPRRTFVSEIKNFSFGEGQIEPNSVNPKRENVIEGHTIVGRLTDTKFVTVYKQQNEIRAVIGNINNNVISYEVPHVLQRILSDEAPSDYFAKVHYMKIAVLSPTRVIISFGSTYSNHQYGKLKAFMSLKINGNSIQEETALTVVSEYGDYTSLLPIAEDIFLVIAYDGSHGTLFMLKVDSNRITYYKNKINIGGCTDIYTNYAMTLLSDSIVAVTATQNNQVWVHPYVINEEGIAKKYQSAVFDLAGAYNVTTALINENKFLLFVGAQGKLYGRTVTVSQNTLFGSLGMLMTGIWYQFNLVRIDVHSFVVGMFTNSIPNQETLSVISAYDVNGDDITLIQEYTLEGTCYGVVERINENTILTCSTLISTGAVLCSIFGAKFGVTVADGTQPILGLTTMAANKGEMATIAIPRGSH